jgi:hypothetical protein
MTASIDTTGLAKMSGGVRRAISGALQKELTENLHEAGPKIVADMKGAAHTRMQRAAAGTINMNRDSKGITIRGGGGGGFPGVVFDGAEYGGRATRKRFYASYQVYGNRALAVRKRATMQFLPHLGREGYFFWPTYRDWLPKLVKEQEAIIEKSLGGGR